jgi:thiamine biosynthesis protein ThiS
MRVRLNGLERELPDRQTLQDLLTSLDLPPGRVAVEHNGDIVPRTKFPDTALTEGDRVEVVQFVGGG